MENSRAESTLSTPTPAADTAKSPSKVKFEEGNVSTAQSHINSTKWLILTLEVFLTKCLRFLRMRTSERAARLFRFLKLKGQ